MKNATFVVNYINKHINDKHDAFMIYLIEQYLTSSYVLTESNYNWQPGFKEANVYYYRVYPDDEMAHNHKTNRLHVIFTNNTEIDISLYKFKKHAKILYKTETAQCLYKYINKITNHKQSLADNKKQETIEKIVKLAVNLNNKKMNFYDSLKLANNIYTDYTSYCLGINMIADSVDSLINDVKKYEKQN